MTPNPELAVRNADRLLRLMTVDMNIDGWQSRECARVACKEVITALREVDDITLWMDTLRILQGEVERGRAG